jgi:hypothetical protein
MVQQVAPVIGQGQAARRALQQPLAQMILQRGDLPRDRRLADILLARHGGERPGLGHPHEHPEGGNYIHRERLA